MFDWIQILTYMLLHKAICYYTNIWSYIKSTFLAIQWIVSPEPAPPTVEISCVEDLILSEGYVNAVNKKLWLIEHLKMSQTQIADVAQITIGQRDNPLWSFTRKNRLTASNFGIVLAAIRRNRYFTFLSIWIH